MPSKKMQLIFLAIAAIVIISGNAYQHELAHVAAFEDFGMENISISIHLGGLTTTAQGYCNDYCKLASSNIEAVGYNLIGIQGILFFIAGLIIVFHKEDNQ